MKVMIVASNKIGSYAPFIMDQVKELSQNGVDFSFFPITRKGIKGYLKSVPELKKAIRAEKPDLIHAHYGLSGLVANLQRKCPVITTFHGSDINVKKNRRLSRVAHWLSSQSIFVSEDLKSKVTKSKGTVIPCGIDTSLFADFGKESSRQKLGLDSEKKYVLFSSGFERPVKNYPLAKKAMQLITDKNAELLELKGYSREEIPIIMSACDCGLVTSHSESGPLFVKEAIACGLPIVSVDVGVARESISGTQGNHIVSRDSEEIAKAINMVLELEERSKSNGKEMLFCNKKIGERILKEYKTIVCKD